MAATILVVEDEATVAALIHDALASEEHVLVHATNCAEGWRFFETLRPALVILDIGLPDASGLTVAKKIRAHPTLSETPIIVLTARGQFKDKESGFEAGADHYLVKPIQIKELRLWVQALMRRIKYTDKEGGILHVGDFIIDPAAHRVTVGSDVIKNLTRKEFDLLYELARHRPKVLSKQFILSSLWNTVLRDNTVEVHIKNLRAKLGPGGQRIVTVAGVGYRFE